MAIRFPRFIRMYLIGVDDKISKVHLDLSYQHRG